MKRQYGLQDLEKDDRDFSLGAFDTLPELSDLPSEFELPFTVKHQGTTDWCSAYATCAASEVQEEVELDPAYSFAATKRIQGNVESWGADLRSACKSHVKFGALEYIDGRQPNLTLKERRDFKHWDKYRPEATLHRKKSYFQTKGPYDAFDNIRASLVKYHTPVVIGIQFGYKLSEMYLEIPKQGFGHAMTVIGYRDKYLTVGNSYGEQAGDGGVHYISREVINYWVKRYGAFTFIDVDPEQVKYNKQYGILKGDNWLKQFWKITRSLWC